MRNATRMPLLFALGAIVGTAADQIHLRCGVLSYPRGSALLFGQPLWVPLLFGGAAVALVLGHAPWLRPGREHAPPASTGGFAASVLWFYVAYAATGVLHGTPRVLALALAALWGGRVAIAPTVDKAIAGPLYAIAGTLFESALSSTGAFHYRAPDLLLVPAWLPALYLHVSLMTREAYLVFFPPRPAGAMLASPHASR